MPKDSTGIAPLVMVSDNIQGLPPCTPVRVCIPFRVQPQWNTPLRVFFGNLSRFVLGSFPGISVLELAGAISLGSAVALTRFCTSAVGIVLTRQHPQHHELALLGFSGFMVGLGLVQGGFQACLGQDWELLRFRYWGGLVLVYGGLLGVGLGWGVGLGCGCVYVGLGWFRVGSG